jgi:guanosine-3',5'-bis(diphosphate) 3'-pyrophosphohydrolase
MTLGATADMATADVLRALQFAAHHHRHQRRKDAEATPYINHPITLAHLLSATAGVTDPVVLAAALLHDTVEDTAATLADLEQQFGPEVAAVVAQVTDGQIPAQGGAGSSTKSTMLPTCAIAPSW